MPHRRSSRRVWLFIALAVVAVVAGAWWVWHIRAPAPGSAPVGRRDPNAKPAPVAVATAKSSDFNVYLSALGTVTPIATVTVHSRVDGQLMRLAYREGDTVKAGQLLAEIDPRSFEVQVEQANGQLAKDRALLANANVDLDRYKTLLAQDSIASQQVDTQASLVKQYEATIASDQAQVDAAKLSLSYTKIVAPISGRLGLRQVDLGNMVHASDSNGIVVITQVQPIDVVYALPEVDLPQVLRQLHAGEPMPVDALSRDATKKLASGKVLTVDNQIDTTTGTVKLKAEFSNDDTALFPNQFVNIRMLVETLHAVTVVPSAAIQRGTQGNFVYLVGADSVVAVRVVVLGPVDGETTVISKGVAPGDIVVIDGTDRLREGQKVETVSRDTTVVPTGAPRARSSGTKGGRGGLGKGAPADGSGGAGAADKGAANSGAPAAGNAGGKGGVKGGGAINGGAPATGNAGAGAATTPPTPR
ncbi:MAG TPA: MdtA/MuxA family multidrug efflux RND transporter periplasmic adaptor subunit [Casimicrobiaceae bacterium]